MRITKQDVHGMFRRFLKAIDGQEATKFDDHGMFTLDHNSTYGGYMIEQIEMDSTGVNQPFLSKRLPAKEMYDTLYMAVCALGYYKEKEGD